MKMFVARDRDFSLSLYSIKPIRNEEEGYWVTNSPLSIIKIDKDLFSDLTWEMEPKEVELNFIVPVSNDDAVEKETDENNNAQVETVENVDTSEETEMTEN